MAISLSVELMNRLQHRRCCGIYFCFICTSPATSPVAGPASLAFVTGGSSGFGSARMVATAFASDSESCFQSLVGTSGFISGTNDTPTLERKKEINVPTPEAAFGTAVKENPSIIYSNISWHNS